MNMGSLKCTLMSFPHNTSVSSVFASFESSFLPSFRAGYIHMSDMILQVFPKHLVSVITIHRLPTKFTKLYQIITYYIILLQFCSRRLAVVVGAPFETAGSGGCIRGKYAPPQYRDGQLWGCSTLAGLRHLWRKRGSCWESVTSKVYDMDFRSFQYFWSIFIYT